MGDLSEQWSAKGSIGVKDMQTDKAQVAASTILKKNLKKTSEVK